MRFSIVILAFNSEGALGQCLDTLANSDHKDFEVIVVDDGSRGKPNVAQRSFPVRVVSLTVNRGPACAREAGLRGAKNDIVVFIDSDVLIAKDTLSKVRDDFEREADIVAVVGILSKEHPNRDFFSVYKNAYMHYIFSKCPRYIDFIYGSFFAIKKRYYERPVVNERYGEDTEMGMRVAAKGHTILLDKELEVRHLKKYTIGSFFSNDFRIPYHWARLFIVFKGWKMVFEKGRYFHSNSAQLLSLILAPLMLLGIFRHELAFVGILFLAANLGFFVTLYEEYGSMFIIKAICITWVDMLVMDLGICAGCVAAVFKKRTTI